MPPVTKRSGCDSVPRFDVDSSKCGLVRQLKLSPATSDFKRPE